MTTIRARRSIASTASELRTYAVGLTLAHRHLEQLIPEMREAVLGNVGTVISFRVGPEDARDLAREFEPVFKSLDLVNLPNHQIYLKLTIDGTPSQPFSAATLSPTSISLRHWMFRLAATKAS